MAHLCISLVAHRFNFPHKNKHQVVNTATQWKDSVLRTYLHACTEILEENYYSFPSIICTYIYILGSNEQGQYFNFHNSSSTLLLFFFFIAERRLEYKAE